MTTQIQSQDQKDDTMINLQSPDQMIRSPIELTDRLLVLVRWAVIIASGGMSAFDGFGGSTFALPMAVWLAAVAYNPPISFYVWRYQPLLNRRGKWLLWADLAQAIVIVALTGGYRSFYFVLFLLVMTELAMVYPWRFALAFVFGVGGLEVGGPADERFHRHSDPVQFLARVEEFLAHPG